MGDVGGAVGQGFMGAVAAPSLVFTAPLDLLRGKSATHSWEKWVSAGKKYGSGEFLEADMPDYEAPELPKVPDAPEPEAPTEVGDEGIRKGSMRRQAKRRTLNQLHLTQGQDRDMTLGGYRSTLAG